MSNCDNSNDQKRESSIQEIVDGFLQECSSGSHPDIDLLIQSHDDLMPELGVQLQRAKMIAVARNFVRHDSTALISSGTERSHSSKESGTGLTVRCPICRAPIVIPVDTPWGEITCSACGSPFSIVDNHFETRQAQTIKTLGHFELIERIGLGGFGSVWKARDTILDRTVAVKIPREGQVDEKEADRFLREARAAAQLRHPNIVSIHEVGRADDTVFIVSDLIRGVVLSDWLNIEKPEIDAVVRKCITIARALNHAHQAGIVHRDLKPGNIIIDNDGEPHIMDFGLAKRETGEVTIAVDGQVIGTPAYMSPEQAKGEANSSDLRTDIYSLGVILFQMLTGELPFRGNIRMLIQQVIYDEPPPLRKLNNLIPRDLENVCLRCLEKESSRRYGTANELANELERFLSGSPVNARPIGKVSRAIRWCKRKPIIASLLSMILLCVLAGGSVSAYFFVAANQANLRELKASREKIAALQSAKNANIEVEQSRSDLKSAAQAFSAAIDSTTSSSTDYRRRRHNMRMSYVDQFWKSHPTIALSQLEDAVHCPSDERDFAWRYLWHQCMAEHLVIRDHWPKIDSVQISQKAGMVVALSRTLLAGYELTKFRRLWSIEMDTNKQSYFSVIPASGNLVLLHESNLREIDAASGQVIRDCGELGAPITKLAVSFDGGQLAWVESNVEKNSVVLCRTDNLSDRHTLFESKHLIKSLSFSPNGKLLGWIDGSRLQIWRLSHSEFQNSPEIDVAQFAFNDVPGNGVTLLNDSRLIQWDLETNSKTSEADAPIDSPLQCIRDGKTLFGGNKLTIGSTDSGDSYRTWTIPFGPFTSGDYSVEDRVVATAGVDGTLHLMRLPAPPSIYKLRPIPDDGDSRISSDGQLLATWHPRREIRITNPIGNERLQRIQPNAEIDLVEFSKNHEWLAVGSKDSVLLYDTETGKKQHVLSHDSNVTCIAFSSDRRVIATVDSNQRVYVWRPSSGEHRIDTIAYPDRVTAIGILNESQSHAILLGFADGRIAVQREGQSLEFADVKHLDVVRQISIVNKGVGRQIQMLTVDASGNPILQLVVVPESKSKAVHFSSAYRIPIKSALAVMSGNGRTLATVDGNRIQFWDGFTGAYRAESDAFEDDVCDLAFKSPFQLLALTRNNRAVLMDISSDATTSLKDFVLRHTGGSVQSICAIQTATSERFAVAGNGMSPTVIDLDCQPIGNIWLDDQPNCIRSSFDHSRFLIGDTLGRVSLVRDTESKSTQSWQASNVAIQDVAMASDRCVTLAVSGEITLWNTNVLSNPVGSIDAHQVHPNGLAISATAEFLAIYGPTGMQVWKLDEFHQQIVFSIVDQDIECVHFLPYTNDFATVQADKVEIHRTGKVQQELDVLGARCLAVSTDGHQLAIGTDDGRVLVFENGKEFVETSSFQSHSSVVTVVEFSRDASRIFSGGLDGTIVNRVIQRTSATSLDNSTSSNSDSTSKEKTELTPDKKRILEMFEAGSTPPNYSPASRRD